MKINKKPNTDLNININNSSLQNNQSKEEFLKLKIVKIFFSRKFLKI